MSMTILSALHEDFPTDGVVLGAPRARRPGAPKDATRFARNMAAIARRSRQRTWVLTGVLLSWYAVMLVVALFTDSPYTSVLALGTASGGTPWIVNTLHRLGREQLWAELLLEAATRTPDQLGSLVELARGQLGGAVESDTADATAGELGAAAPRAS